MINFDDYTNENTIWNDYAILVAIHSRSSIQNTYCRWFRIRKSKCFIEFNKISIHNSKREKVGLDHIKDPKDFMEYSNDMQDFYKNIEDYNPNKKRKILIVFDDMIADMINNKKLNPVVTEVFIRGKNLKISVVFITQSYFRFYTLLL